MITAGAAASVARELEAISGRENVVENPDELVRFNIDGVQPAIAVSPGTPQEVAQILRFAYERSLVVVPAGGFTDQTSGAVPERIDILLRTPRLKSVEHYDPGDLTLGAGAGFTLAEIERMLASYRQFLPWDPARPQAATIGCALATAAHGPLKHGFGGVRDFCIGVKFVTGDGKLAKGGGRVMKNVAGYDLMKLMAGSVGSLGVIVSANFKVFPRPQQTRTFVANFLWAPGAVLLRDMLLKSPLTPMCLEIISPRAVEYFDSLTNEPENSARALPLLDSKCWRICVRAGGSEAVLGRYRSTLGSAVTTELDGEAEAQLWRAISNFRHTVAVRHRNAMMVNVSVPLTAVADALAAGERAATQHNFLFAAVGRAGIGSLVMAFIPIAVDPPSTMQYANAASAFRANLPQEASAVVTSCPHEAKNHFSVWGSSPTDVECMRAVKRTLDPRNILNRGRFLF